jgi:hypothetical protein
MAVHVTVEQREKYAVVRLEGTPTLDEFLPVVQALGTQSRSWPTRKALVDLRGIRSLRAFTEHYAVGEAVARHWAHMRAVASVVPPDRLTRASEKVARQASLNLTVFTDEGEAMAWLAGQ